MKVIELKPIKVPVSDYDKVEARIKEVFRKLVYRPILEEFYIPKKMLNAKNDELFEALRTGKINYQGGAFTGKFSAQITKQLKAFGAVWDRASSSFKLPLLPVELRDQIQSGSAYFEDKMSKIDKKLAALVPAKIAEKVKVAEFFDSALWKVEKDFQKSIEKVAVGPQLTKEQSAKIADEWQTNMDLWIREFSEKEIKRLRDTVKKAVYAGDRYETLIDGIKKSYQVTDNKAKFLARQETNLLMAKFKESRYTESGIHEYIWGCVKMPHDTSPDRHVPGNVRYYHGILEGRVFRWDDPPITNKNPERRNNPGQDYNCRCFVRPIVRTK